MIDSLQAVPVLRGKASARGEEGHGVPSRQLSPLGTKRTYDLPAPGGTKFQASCLLHHSAHLHMLHVGGGDAGSATDRTQRFDTNTDVCMHSHEAAYLDQGCRARTHSVCFRPVISLPLVSRPEGQKRFTAARDPHVRCPEGCDRAESERSALPVMALTGQRPPSSSSTQVTQAACLCLSRCHRASRL